MDASKCFEILQTKARTPDPEKEVYLKASLLSLEGHSDLPLPPSNEKKSLSDLDNIILMNLFTTLQGERVQVYFDFDAALEILCKESRLQEYPNLCAEVTSRFSVISRKINEIKDVFDKRSLENIVTLIAQIQSFEKEKLLLVAAQHLDIMHEKSPSMAFEMGETMTLISSVASIRYSSDKINELKSKISESLDEFQELKCDFLET